LNLNSLSRSVTIRPIIIVIAIVRMIPPMITVRMIVISMVVIPMAIVSMGILAINPDRYACARISRFYNASSGK